MLLQSKILLLLTYQITNLVKWVCMNILKNCCVSSSLDFVIIYSLILKVVFLFQSCLVITVIWKKNCRYKRNLRCTLHNLFYIHNCKILHFVSAKFGVCTFSRAAVCSKVSFIQPIINSFILFNFILV